MITFVRWNFQSLNEKSWSLYLGDLRISPFFHGGHPVGVDVTNIKPDGSGATWGVYSRGGYSKIDWRGSFARSDKSYFSIGASLGRWSLTWSKNRLQSDMENTRNIERVTRVLDLKRPDPKRDPARPRRFVLSINKGKGAGYCGGWTLFFAYNCKGARYCHGMADGRFVVSPVTPNPAPRVRFQFGFTRNANLVPYVY